MFNKFGGVLGRLVRKAKIAATLMSVATVTAITTVIASAEEPSTGTTVSSTFDFSSIIASAGKTLETCLTNLVTSLTPVLITVSVSGLGIYAVIMLFTIAKKLFKKAAG